MLVCVCLKKECGGKRCLCDECLEGVLRWERKNRVMRRGRKSRKTVESKELVTE